MEWWFFCRFCIGLFWFVCGWGGCWWWRGCSVGSSSGSGNSCGVFFVFEGVGSFGGDLRDWGFDSWGFGFLFLMKFGYFVYGVDVWGGRGGRYDDEGSCSGCVGRLE